MRDRIIYAKIDRKKISLIHVIKEELKMSDENYRLMLKSNFNVESSKDLTTPQFERLMELFEKAGFKSKYLTYKQKKNIKKRADFLWRDKADEKLREFIMQQVGEDIPLARLTVKEAQNVINGLTKIQEWKGKVKER